MKQELSNLLLIEESRNLKNLLLIIIMHILTNNQKDKKDDKILIINGINKKNIRSTIDSQKNHFEIFNYSNY